MKFGKLSLGIAAAALATAPVLAQAAFAPTVAPLDGDESELSQSAAIIVGVLATGALVLGIVASSSDNDTELPVSN